MADISPEQCRAARALLSWRQDELEEASGVTKKTIADFERRARTPRPATLAAITSALEKAGIKFIEKNGGGSGVRLRG